jgi:ankyrin repeat protein
LEVKNPQHYTPLMRAVYNDYEEIAEALITAGTILLQYVYLNGMNRFISRKEINHSMPVRFKCMLASHIMTHNFKYAMNQQVGKYFIFRSKMLKTS